MRQVSRHRVGGVRDRGEAFVAACAHETVDLRNTLAVHARRDVDQYDRAEHRLPVGRLRLTLCQKRCDAAE